MSAANTDEEICPICNKEINDADASNVSKLFQKGADKINESSRKRGREDVVVTEGQRVHKDCRRWYTSEQYVNQTLKGGRDSSPCVRKKSARVSIGPYNCRTDCLFCGQAALGHGNNVSEVKTDAFPQTILAHCEERSDDWSFSVQGRIEYFGKDLHAAECIYHQQCSVNFRSGRDIPEQFRTEPVAKRRKSGRPKNEDQQQAFLRVCAYLEANDEEQLTITDLAYKMRDYLLDETSVPYGNQYLKQNLKNHYGDSIYIAEQGGVQDIVTMREKTSQILGAYFKSAKSSDEESQKRAIIATAAKLIKCDIKTNVQSITDQYPSSQSLKLDAALNYLPASLRLLLNLLFVGTNKHKKVASIGQSIIQAVRPRAVLAPLQIGLATQLHHLYRSRFLVDTLSVMGFGSSYGEAQRFEKNAAGLVAPDVLGEDVQGMVLFVADNVDHNIQTLDGKGTFHGMGIIAAITPGKEINHVVPRKNVSALKATELSRIDIVDYRFSDYARKHVMFDTLPVMDSCVPAVDVLWELSFCFRQQTPNWQGMMHLLHGGNEHPGKSSVHFLPMIDMYPGDPTCILSTLNYVCNLADRHKISPIITFDQPLFWKASEIIYNAQTNSPLKEITLMLGSFHTFMNVLGAIGTLMQSSGLREILEEVYGENAVKHMFTGKSVQRAFRGHLLVEKCLNGVIVSDLIDSDSEFSNLVDQCENSYTSLIAGENNLESLTTSDLKIQIKQALEKRIQELSSQSRTSKLWLSYINMVKLGRMLIMADRMGSWKAHLSVVAECLPIFAAAGHFNYLKSAYLYLQNMQQLEKKNPTVHRMFEEGLHVIRRTDQFWAGLGCDLVIEQTLMRSLKSTGGLTRGSGMTEEQRTLWTLSSPVCSVYNAAMQDFNNLGFTTSEQHKDSTESRMKRDQLDLAKIKEKLESCTPFSVDPSLRNIVTGVVAKDDVNVDDFKSVGKTVIEKMTGQPVFTYTCKRKEKAKTMGDASAVKVTSDRTIDPALLFQRLLVISRAGDVSLEEALSYELCPFPSALFDANNIFRKADKPQLAKAIYEHSSSSSDDAVSDKIPKTEHYVIDGGSLMHRVKWTKGSSYGTIANDYVDLTLRSYGKATVVFDGYLDEPSIKDNAHLRRQQTNHPIVNFTAETVFMGKKEEFLSRGCNKQGLINIISQRLKEKGCNVINARGDADCDIVQAAIAASEFQSTTLIGEDTDLLILLLYHAKPERKSLYYRSDKSKSKIRVYNINELKCLLGNELCSLLLFVHAFTGCDTTSRIFGIGKKVLFQKVSKGDTGMKSCALAFTKADQGSDIIEENGLKAMILLFGGNVTSDTLTSLRHSILTKKVVSSTSFVTPERLPPTASATKYHSFRVYYQIMTWIGKETDIDATDWGWKSEANQFIPVMTDQKAAPDNLLKVVHCNCTTGCSTQRCNCRRYGLPCTSACGQCQLDSCNNPHNHSEVDQDAENDDDDQ